MHVHAVASGGLGGEDAGIGAADHLLRLETRLTYLPPAGSASVAPEWPRAQADSRHTPQSKTNFDAA